MKKHIAFLCRFPGTFIVTFIIVAILFYFHKNNLDERWWLVVLLSVMTTLVCNLYLFLVQAEKQKEVQKFWKWVGFFVVLLLTGLNVLSLIALKLGNNNHSVHDNALANFLLESMSGVLLWGWFSLFFNMNMIITEPILNQINSPTKNNLKQ